MIKFFKNKIIKNAEIFALFLLILITVISTSYYNYSKKKILKNYKVIINNIYLQKTFEHVFNSLEPRFKIVNHKILPGETFDKILEKYSVKKDEISEIITHVTFYSGFPTGVNASRIAAEVFEGRGLSLSPGRFPGAPYLEELIDGLVYRETWTRDQLSSRDRSLATIAVTLAGYQSDQLRVHLSRGLDNGVTPQEISELIAHVTLYSGFPTGVNASRMFAELLRERGIPLPD